MNNFLCAFIKLAIVSEETSSSSPFSPDDFLSKLIPNFWSFLVQLLALIVLIIAAIFLAYRPVKKLLKKRSDYVEGNIKESENKNKMADSNIEQSKQTIIQSKEEAQSIVKKAQFDALENQKIILDESRTKADEEIAQARVQIAHEQKKAKEEIRKEIIDVAIEASTKILEREVNKNDNERLVDQFIDDVKSDKEDE